MPTVGSVCNEGDLGCSFIAAASLTAFSAADPNANSVGCE